VPIITLNNIIVQCCTEQRICEGEDEEPWKPVLEYYSGYTHTSLRPFVAKLAALLKAAPDAKLKVRCSS
jgi:hypothetical protein